MATLQISDGLTIDYTNDGWTEFKKWIDGTYAWLSFIYVDLGLAYDIAAIDGKVYRIFSINKTDATDFETNFKNRANVQNVKGTFDDPRFIRRFGNLTATSTSEVLLSARAYVEQSSQAQRSVVSTSVQDKSSGTGAATVRVTYLDSNYVLKTEDVALNGTVAVNTVATDIRFIEKFQVIRGSAAAGAIKLMTTTGGGGSEFCGIGIATYDAFLCHHYVPAGKSGFVWGWYACVTDETKFKLMGRSTYGSYTVDENWDLHDLMGITPPGHLEFNKTLTAVPFSEKAYIRITVVPNQSTSTIIRGDLIIWER